MAGRQFDIVGLDVADAGVEVPQAIVARVRFDGNGARVP
jgi:hypothetical protein